MSVRVPAHAYVNERRYGRFSISTEVWHHHPTICMEALRDVLVIEATPRAAMDGEIHYIGVSHHFEPVDQLGGLFPWYEACFEIAIDTSARKTVRFSEWRALTGPLAREHSCYSLDDVKTGDRFQVSIADPAFASLAYSGGRNG